ncbi:unnamed protein product, partial [Musa acuminata subsp. burmannicoides]
MILRSSMDGPRKSTACSWLDSKKLGKGDWRGISRSFVTRRTPTQVASHSRLHKKKSRSRLFD